MEREEPRTRMVPDLKDIRTYLMLDMMPVMTAGIQEALDSGRLAEITQSPLVSEAVHSFFQRIDARRARRIMPISGLVQDSVAAVPSVGVMS